MEDQWRVVNKHRICSSCLADSHLVAKCPLQTRDVKYCQDCGYTHHGLLQCCPSELRSSERKAGPTFTTLTCHRINKSSHQPSYARTCPVIVRHPASRSSVEGLAIIDDQSEGTFMDTSVVYSLGIPKDQLQPSRLATTTV